MRHEAATRELLLGRVLGGGLCDHRRDHAIVAHIPIRCDLPAFAVPGLDSFRARALVVRAGHLDRTQHALETEVLDAIRGEIKAYEPQRTCSPVSGFLPNFAWP
jgi:hypothetical protein